MEFSIVKLPPLTTDNLKDVMNERLAATKNHNTVIPMLWQGLLKLPVEAGGLDRTALYYIPKDTPQGTAMVILNVPDGMETLPFLQESGWMAAADSEGFCLFVVEPGDGGWKPSEDEEAYLRAAVSAAKQGRYCMTAFAPYTVGYGRIGAVLHKIAMDDPLHTAAAVFLDAASIDTACRAAYETKEYVIPSRFDPAVPPLRTPYKDIPIPVWIVSQEVDAQTTAMVDYWKRAAKAGVPRADDVLGTVYMQDGPTEYTPEGNIVKVAVSTQHLDYCDKGTTKAIYAFLKQYYRYGMGPLSNMISKRIDHAGIGVEHRRFTDSNGIDREYLVYVPAAYRDGKNKLPTIVAYHGASQSMRNMMDNGLWYKVADREGLVVVYPESGLTTMPGELAGNLAFAYRPIWALMDDGSRHMDLAYANELLDRVIAEFPVDEKQIYCTGHSMGCMMSNYLGSDATGHRFAAIGATSGCLMFKSHSASQSIPTFMTIGQFDLWSYRLCDEGPVADEIDMWLVQNGLASEETVKQVRLHANETYQEGRWNNYVWKDAAGTPWVRYAWLTNKHHVHTYEENGVLWEQWFSRWQIGEDGQRHYRSTK